MENVWNIRKKEKLYFVLPDTFAQREVKEDVLKRTAIIMYLYYVEDVQKYLLYLCEIPLGIHVYIITSNKEILDFTTKYVRKMEYVTVIQKENRGRDVSALLVAGKDIWFQYDYLCFVHDKKPKERAYLPDFDFWIKNIWENTIKNENYIRNVLDTLIHDDKIGVLAPPEPIGEYINAWYGNAWYGEYDNTVKLSEKLRLNADIDIQYPPIALSTAFWCKTQAITKLFDIPWSYSDFPAEPFPEYETISHAVERIFPYLAQDAGYKTGIVMTSSYAAEMFAYLQTEMKSVYDFLRDEMQIQNAAQVKKYIRCKESFKRFCSYNRKVYLYGAGKVGEKCLRILDSINEAPEAIIVTDLENNDKVMKKIPIIDLAMLNNKKNSAIIVAVGENLTGEVKQKLVDEGFTNYICYIDI